jgi:hypothetical protein
MTGPSEAAPAVENPRSRFDDLIHRVSVEEAHSGIYDVDPQNTDDTLPDPTPETDQSSMTFKLRKFGEARPGAMPQLELLLDPDLDLAAFYDQIQAFNTAQTEQAEGMYQEVSFGKVGPDGRMLSAKYFENGRLTYKGRING